MTQREEFIYESALRAQNHKTMRNIKNTKGLEKFNLNVEQRARLIDFITRYQNLRLRISDNFILSKINSDQYLRFMSKTQTILLDHIYEL